MKKLSALIIGFCLLGFTATNATAACECGYIFELGGGTITQVVDLTAGEAQSFVIASDCGTYSMVQGTVQNCKSVQMSPIIVEYPSGNAYQTKRFAESPFGTGTFSTYATGSQTGDQCDVTLTKAIIGIQKYFYPGEFSSTQSDDCTIDFAAYLTLAGGFDAGHDGKAIHNFDGYVTADPTVGVKVYLEGDQTSMVGFPIATIINDITLFRVEYYSRLPEDVNDDGFVSGADFGAVVSALNAGAAKACSCNGYFQ